jgi:hypothetical protein
MRTRVRWLAVVVLLLLGASARAQVKDKDAVELLPAQTLACLELRQPVPLSREVAALVKGSILDDLPRLLAKNRAENRGFRYSQEREMLATLGVFLCPEMINEAGRIRGGVIALTGFAKDGRPEVAGVLQNGTSNFPGMYVKGFLSFARPRLVVEVEGVSLFREVSYWSRSGPGGQIESGERESGPAIGQMPGLLLLGSSVDSLKDVIRRAKRKSAEASLTNLRAFKESASLRERPGLFAYVDGEALEAKLEELFGKEKSPRSSWTALSTVLGKQSVRKLLFSLTLHNGALEGQSRLDLNDKSDSPLLGLMPDRAAPRDLLHFAPKNALLAVSGGLGDGEKRWKTLMKLLDAQYQLNGGVGDNRPSIFIREKEKKVNLHVDKDVLAQLSGAGVVVPKDWYVKPNQWTLLLRAVDADAAAALEKTGLPRLLSMGAEEALKPQETEIQGHRIKTIGEKGGKQLSPFPLHYGRSGSVLVVGPDPDRVAEALVAGGKKAGLLGNSKVAEAVKDIDDKAALIGVASPSQAALDLFALLSRPSSRPMMKLPPGAAPPPPPAIKPLEETKKVQELRKAAEPLVFSLNRQPDRLVLEMRPLPLRRMAPRLLEVWVEAAFKRIAEGDSGNGGAIEAVPPAGIKR